ncbi:sigma 54-interacting transcriptional regulator [Clostridiaceae bacterium 35-E11]
MEKDRLTKIKAIEAVRKQVTMVGPNTTVKELNELMILKKQEEVVVINEDHEIIGIITKNDLAKNLARGVDKSTPIKYIMSTNVICMSPDKDLIELRDEMRKAGVGRAPVIDEKHNILGILTVKSICDGFSRRLEEVVNYLNDILNNLEECIFVIDEDGKIIYNNRAAEEEFELYKQGYDYTVEDLFTKDIAVKIMNNTGNIQNMKLTQNHKQFLLNTSSFHDRSKSFGMIVNMRNITDMKMIEEKLDKTNIQLKYLQEKVQQISMETFSLGNIVTLNKEMKHILEVAKRVAQTMATVLITGESGTGKEVLAKAIFEDSERKDKAFVTINCGAIPYNLLESELFGYEQGAFTGANKYGKAGIFELADGGTIFLDEIGELPLDMQVKLLRVLEEQVFYRVGGTRPIKVDVRIIAATNRDLEAMMKENKFREDLYYRINVIKLEIPALRNRKEDIPALIHRFLKYACEFHHKKVEQIDKDVLKILLDYHWPGNIRELKNIVERMVILSQNKQITWEDLPPYLLEQPKTHNRGTDMGKMVLQDREKAEILRLLKLYKGNKSKVAKKLNIPRSTLYYKLKIFQIEDV